MCTRISLPLFCRIASGNKGIRQLEAFPRLWHGFSRLGSRSSGCLVEFSASIISKHPGIARLTTANEYLHVPSVSRQEFNKVKPRRRESEVGRMRCVALRACIRVLSVPLENGDDDLTPRLAPPPPSSLLAHAGPLTSRPPFTTPVNSGRNHRALL